MTQVKSIDTINVITYSNGGVTSCFTFNTDEDGVKAAEEKFSSKIVQYVTNGGEFENEFDEDEMSVYLEDGHFETEDGGFEIYLLTSDSTVVEIEK